MGIRSITKYFSLLKVAFNLYSKGMEWMEAAKDEAGPGGEEITAAEYAELAPIIEEAISDALGIAVRLKMDEETGSGG